MAMNESKLLWFQWKLEQKTRFHGEVEEIRCSIKELEVGNNEKDS
jgi:hypothetical protein